MFDGDVHRAIARWINSLKKSILSIPVTVPRRSPFANTLIWGMDSLKWSISRATANP